MTYDLFDLPTAQHKAGLAGLLFQIRHMEGKSPKPAAIPKVAALTATSATIEFTADSVQCLFDDLYATDIAVVRTKTEWDAQEAKPSEVVEEEIDDEDNDGNPIKKKVKVKYFFYHQEQPCGNAIRQYIRDEPELWLKLWRDMLWAIPRGNPQSRKPYKERAKGLSCSEGAEVWGDLLKAEKARANSEFRTDEVAGALWLGAQAVNAESVPFEGRVEQTLLLHFWPLTVQVYAPQAVQPDGENEFVGYVLAIPEVSDLEGFLKDYPRLLGNLSGDIRGYRPAEAVIDLPAEGALSFLEHLARLTSEKTTDIDYNALAYNLGSVEFLHLAKFGNNIKTLASGRVAPRPGLMHGYLQIVGKTGEKAPYANPLFRRGLMLALLEGRPWFQPFGKLFAEWDVSFFIPTDAPPKLSWFWADARRKIQEIIQAMPTAPNPDDKSPEADDLLMMLIHRLTRTYLAARAKEKSGIDPEQFKDGDKIAWDKLPKDFHDARRAAGESLFYEFRSRRDQAFVQHFAQTFFATKQYVSEDHYTEIGRALMTRTDDVKTLTLMALSANS
ncbi:type I-MYXAN CRISPR-associated protein Cmx8 [Gemmata sp. JC673]|uniref:Type I-MYXAN CRISPR-associated protein Cmx8 n=1 Tax=Gemmata algarum TaxID=2975278 RepID=A0ABU5F617_9BACT|nr:type I-MYXAN CRISPR-associated protein Cmx8 [Gemmata algarum]MDY3562202.1 type I-MYXAN CRISPR-associated protein Cmx8 [Gemmata algarum]